jgi:hypothetical protein
MTMLETFRRWERDALLLLETVAHTEYGSEAEAAAAYAGANSGHETLKNILHDLEIYETRNPNF